MSTIFQLLSSFRPVGWVLFALLALLSAGVQFFLLKRTAKARWLFPVVLAGLLLGMELVSRVTVNQIQFAALVLLGVCLAGLLGCGLGELAFGLSRLRKKEQRA